MDILSLDILQSLKLLLSPWRWKRREQPGREDEVLRYNVGGLEILVLNRGGEILNKETQVNMSQVDTDEDEAVEYVSFNLKIERSVRLTPR